MPTTDSTKPATKQDVNNKPPAQQSRHLSVGTGEGQVSPSTTNSDALGNASADESNAEWVRSGKKEAVYNPNRGLGVRVGGPFLDEIQAEQNEIRSAKLEGRAPDFDNPQAGTAYPLYTAGQMANAFGGGSPAVVQMIEDNEDNDKVGPRPVGKVDLVGYGEKAVFDTKKEEQEAARNLDNTTISSFDNPGMIHSPNIVGDVKK
jgi:hypothetical protein